MNETVKTFATKEEIKILATKAELKAEQDKIGKLQAFVSSYFCGKNHFEDDETQNYLMIKPIYGFFKKIGNTNHVLRIF